MAVAIIMEFTGATLEQYDQVIGKMGLTPEKPGPAGSLGHWVAATDTGIIVTDLWQTKELFDTFAKEQIGPITAEAGFPEPPKVTYLDAHNYFMPGAAA
ncbi:hypothetical protein AB4Y86_02860 [Arthrobacter sp. 2YAF22_2]|jgi:hypothetical protein|uniref:hypothetical protein n=1 Tax=Arthrobacter sp. 2YAF22_2 TaxID=3233029 RepID=UPI003F8F9CC6